MKSTKRLKPNVGDIVEHHLISNDIEIRGEVIDLLDTQFTVHIHKPDSCKGTTHFIFYNDDYVIV